MNMEEVIRVRLIASLVEIIESRKALRPVPHAVSRLTRRRSVRTYFLNHKRLEPFHGCGTFGDIAAKSTSAGQTIVFLR